MPEMTIAEWEAMIALHDAEQSQLQRSMDERPLQQTKVHTVEEKATPYNRPIPQGGWVERSAPTDPTASPIATGGSLLLNDRDRAGLNEWFQSSFQNQFKHRTSWFGTDWFPEYFAPMRDVINANFDKAFDKIYKHDEDVSKLREEMRREITDMEIKLRAEHAAEIVKLKKEFAAKNTKLRKEMALQNSIVRGEVTSMPVVYKG